MIDPHAEMYYTANPFNYILYIPIRYIDPAEQILRDRNEKEIQQLKRTSLLKSWKLMKSIIIHLLLIMSINLVFGQNDEIMLGAEIRDFKSNSDRILIPSGKLVSSTKILINGIEYTLGVNQLNLINFIMTSSPNFQIDGLKLNSKLEEITSNIDELSYIPGWGYYVKINSNWYAGFDFSNRPILASKVNWFFKYDFPDRKDIFLKENE